MNRRTAVVLSSALVGTLALTGCGSLGKSGKSKVTGMVVERDQELNRSGNTVYKLTVTTDRKSIRRKVNRDTKTKDVNVSAEVYNNCGLKETYKNGKC